MRFLLVLLVYRRRTECKVTTGRNTVGCGVDSIDLMLDTYTRSILLVEQRCHNKNKNAPTYEVPGRF